MKQRATLLAVAILALLALLVAPAHAATLVVDDDGKATTTNCNANRATHATIQAAVAAASAGDTIKVCPGTYTGPVILNKADLTLRGAKAGVDARSRSTSNESTVTGNDVVGTVQLRENGIQWDGFTVRGNASGVGIVTDPTFSGHEVINNIVRDNVFGLYLNSSAKFPNLVRHNRFVANNPPGAASGNGIYSDQGVQRVLITANEFENNQNAGIVFANAAPTQRQLTIERNQSVDDARFVALFNTDNTTVARNSIRNDNDNTGSAIFVGGDNNGVLVERNSISEAGFSGIAVRDSLGAAPTNVDIVANDVRDAFNHGIDVTATGVGEVEVRGNTVRKSHQDGLYFGVGTLANLILDNVSKDNGGRDCKDDSTAGVVVGTAGTAHTWSGNTGPDASPGPICD